MKSKSKSGPLKVIIVGAGHRGLLYASYAKLRPDRMKVVGVCDMRKMRREETAELYGLTKEQCYASVDELSSRPKAADAVINGTMDHQHVPTSLPLLRAGYDILLEKPFATCEREMWSLVRTAKKCGRKVMICHVLRYAPFYHSIKKRILNNEIGYVISIQTKEHVSYHHMAVGYVRGKWNRSSCCKSTMLMAKSCHDLDLIVWMKSGQRPVSVASFGSLMQFRRERKPHGAGTRCLVDCGIEKDCNYSARKHYINHPFRWGPYVWDEIEHLEKPSIRRKIESLKSTNPHGRCVWGCDNDVVDHQSVLINFEDGATATHNMIGGCSRPMRAIHIVGSAGEIEGVFDESEYVIRHIDARKGHEYAEEKISLDVKGDMTGAFAGHGGGDGRLVEDFVCFLQGGKPSPSCTSLEDSIYGHLIGFYADKSRENSRIYNFTNANAFLRVQ